MRPTKITSFFARMHKNLAKPNTSNRRKTHTNRGIPGFFTTDELVGREEADFGDLRVYVKAWRVMVIDVRCEAAKIAARIRAQRSFSHARSSRMLWPAATRTTLIASPLAPLSQ